MVGELLEEIQRRTGRGVSSGLQIVSLEGLVSQPFDPGWPLLLLAGEPRDDEERPAAGEPRADEERPAAGGHPLVAGRAAKAGQGPLPGRAVHGRDPLTLLQALYPADHPVLGLAGAADTSVAALTADRLAAGASYLPAVAPLDDLASPHGLPWLAARLRAPDGCPWDRAQTHESLRKHLLEEAYEVYDALESGASPALADELGDLLLQVVLHAQHAAEAGVFDLTDVYRAIDAKIVRRHPHVFGAAKADSVEQVMRNWEQIKADERAARSGAEAPSGSAMPAAFAGLSTSLPALAYSREIQERAAGLGYDWPDVERVIDKIEEETVELLEATTPEARREEFGDLLMVLVNLGRKLGIDAEAALRAGNRKFAARFAVVERLAAAEGRDLRDLDPQRLDDLWRQAKEEVRA